MKTPDRKDFPQPRIGNEAQLNRMAEKRTDREWLAGHLDAPESRYILFCDLSLAVNSNEDQSKTEIRWYGARDIEKFGVSLDHAIFLGCDAHGRAIFAHWLDEAETAAVPGGQESLKPLVDLRSLAMQGALSNEELSLAGMGRALAAWHENTQHCGRCGSRTRSRDAGWRRKCWACGHEYYPRVDPAVIVLITDGDRCLLGHHKRYAHKFYSVLAGFVEPGEDFEACVRREMQEETGVKIGEVKYMAAQPWPFPHLMMIGCWAEALTTELTLEEEELHDARWFTREEVRRMLAGEHPDDIGVPGPHSIAHALIKSFVDMSD